MSLLVTRKWCFSLSACQNQNLLSFSTWCISYKINSRWKAISLHTRAQTNAWIHKPHMKLKACRQSFTSLGSQSIWETNVILSKISVFKHIAYDYCYIKLHYWDPRTLIKICEVYLLSSCIALDLQIYKDLHTDK